MIKTLSFICLTMASTTWAYDLPNCDLAKDDTKRLQCFDTWLAQAKRAAEREATVENQQRPTTNEVHSNLAGNVGVLLPKAQVTLADGSLWQLDETRTVFVSGENPAVHIEVSRFGGYRMNIKGVNRKLKVWRVEE